MRLRYGVHGPLEQAADELLRQSLANVTSREEKSDILTPWKEAHRRGVEVYSSSGFPDASLRQGMFKRARNGTRPNLNSCEGVSRPKGATADGAVESSFGLSEEY